MQNLKTESDMKRNRWIRLISAVALMFAMMPQVSAFGVTHQDVVQYTENVESLLENTICDSSEVIAIVADADSLSDLEAAISSLGFEKKDELKSIMGESSISVAVGSSCAPTTS